MKSAVFVLWIMAGLLCPLPSEAAEARSFSQLGDAPERMQLAAVLQKSLKAYEAVNDYAAVFQKQERSGSVLGPLETIYFKFEKPFKVFMGWSNTHKKGLQVFYERGKHDGKLAIHKPGLLLGLAPLVYLAQDSPWVREGSESYDIEDAGIGSFLDDFTDAVFKGARENRLRVRPGSDPSGEVLDVTFEGSVEGSGYFAHRVIVRFASETALPDRMQLFDWQGLPMGNYAYENIRLNVGPADPEFENVAFGRIYRLYRPSGKAPVSANNFNGKNPRATPTAG